MEKLRKLGRIGEELAKPRLSPGKKFKELWLARRSGPRIAKPWTSEETQTLREFLKDRKPTAELAHAYLSAKKQNVEELWQARRTQQRIANPWTHEETQTLQEFLKDRKPTAELVKTYLSAKKQKVEGLWQARRTQHRIENPWTLADDLKLKEMWALGSTRPEIAVIQGMVYNEKGERTNPFLSAQYHIRVPYMGAIRSILEGLQATGLGMPRIVERAAKDITGDASQNHEAGEVLDRGREAEVAGIVGEWRNHTGHR